MPLIRGALWSEIAAVRDDRIYEIDSAVILQPGPAALTEGVRQLHAILAQVCGVGIDARLRPVEPPEPNPEAGTTRET